jgi:hypothetical protein
METLSLNIPNMKSANCLRTVSDIVNATGARIKNMAPGQIMIEKPSGTHKPGLS